MAKFLICLATAILLESIEGFTNQKLASVLQYASGALSPGGEIVISMYQDWAKLQSNLNVSILGEYFSHRATTSGMVTEYHRSLEQLVSLAKTAGLAPVERSFLIGPGLTKSYPSVVSKDSYSILNLCHAKSR